MAHNTYDHTGDTLGTMDTAEEGPFNQSQHPWYRPRTVALPLPLVAYREGSLTIDASSMRNTCNIGTYVTFLFCTYSTDYCTELVRIIIRWNIIILISCIIDFCHVRTGCTDLSKCSCVDIHTAAMNAGPWTSVDSVMDVKVE